MMQGIHTSHELIIVWKRCMNKKNLFHEYKYVASRQSIILFIIPASFDYNQGCGSGSVFGRVMVGSGSRFAEGSHHAPKS